MTLTTTVSPVCDFHSSDRANSSKIGDPPGGVVVQGVSAGPMEHVGISVPVNTVLRRVLLVVNTALERAFAQCNVFLCWQRKSQNNCSLKPLSKN